MKRPGYYITLLYFFFSFCVPAQNTDSLLTLAGKATTDSAKVELLAQASESIHNDERLITITRQVLELCEKNIPTAKGSLLKYFKRERAVATHGYGVGMENSGKIEEALKYYFKAIKLHEENGSTASVANCYNSLGNFYNSQQEYPSAEKFYAKSIGLYASLGDSAEIGHVLCSVAALQYNLGDKPKALRTLKLSERLLRKYKSDDILISALSNIGAIYQTMDKPDSAILYHHAALQVNEKIGDKSGQVISYANIAGCYLKKKDPEKALNYALTAHTKALELGFPELVKRTSSVLYKINQEKGNFKEALTYYKLLIQMRDSISNEENTKNAVKAEMNYEFEKKEAAAKLEQEKKEAVAEAEKKKQGIILLAISGFGLLVLAFAIFAYRSFLQKKKANVAISEQKHIIEEKQKEILDSIHYAKRIQQTLMPTEKQLEKVLNSLRKGKT